jgi:signal transduction histidine kinase
MSFAEKVNGQDVTPSRKPTRAPQELFEQCRRRNMELEARILELSQALAQVEAAAQLASGSAHDIRNALTVILGEADLLARSSSNPDQLESAQAVTSAAQMANTITLDMLGMTRKGAGTPRVNSAELMAECQQLILRILKPPVRCIFAVDAELWAVEVDQQQLKSALINLSANARDATPRGGNVRIVAHNLAQGTPLPFGLPPGDYVSFSVEDTGEGMSPEVLARAGEAFFTTKGRERGTGLGLAMVKAFAAEAGGAFQLRSALGGGTHVEIVLPRVPAPTVALDAADPRHGVLQKIAGRVRAPWLRQALAAWREACDPRGLPRPFPVKAALIEHAASCLVLAVNTRVDPAQFRVVRMGDDLLQVLQRSALGVALNGPELFGNLEAAYRSAFQSRCPNYQFARYSFGKGSPAQFERLILPAAIDGATVSHLIGVILMTPDLNEAIS